MSPELEPEQPTSDDTRNHPAAAAPHYDGGTLQQQQQQQQQEHGNVISSTVMDSDHDHLNGMDDLFSFGSPCSHGGGGGMGGGHSEDDDCFSVRGDVILTPSGEMIMSPAPASDSPDWRPLLNAVHMELQENAKLPTFHWNVNRTGSAQSTFLRPRIRPPFDSTFTSTSLFHSAGSSATATAASGSGSPQQQQQQQQQLSLMEHFLQKETQSRRHGRHDSYNHQSLHNNNMNSDNNTNKSTKSDNQTIATTDPLLAFLDNIDPTPLEEIKRKHYHRGVFRPQRRDPLPIPTLLSTNNNNNSTADTAPTWKGTTTSPKNQEPMDDNHHQQEVAIVPAATSTTAQPNLDSSSTSFLMHDAVATAAAIVTVATSAVPDSDPTTGTTDNTSSTNTTSTNEPRCHSTPHTTKRPRPGRGYAARHAVPIRSLQTASTQKSQYGFGRRHVVPSVPARPPQPARTPAARHRDVGSGSTTPTTTTTTAAAKPSGGDVTIRTITTASGPTTSSSTSGNTGIQNNNSNSSHDFATSQQSSSFSRNGSAAGDEEDDRESSTNGGSSDAYERKKQRAKNARVRLNESIDRLAIAINLAGTQSHERATLFEEWNYENNSSISCLGHVIMQSNNNNSFSTTSAAANCVNIIRECVTTAEDAKKWDRPNFVGSAATLLQGMNAQCEALMRELQTVHQENVELRQRQATRLYSDDHDNPALLFPQHKHSLDDLHVNHSGKRRRRLDGGRDRYHIDNEETAADRLVFSERTIMDRVASFLEPLSIVRCMRVSKAWKDWGIFSNEPLWQNLAVERFGYFNVRQWRGLLEDHPPPPPPMLHGDDAVARTMTASARVANASSSIAISSTLLYKKMDAANVMPHFRHEGTFLLGEARLPGKVSAWTFLVERSNGETMRSVLRPPGHPGTGPYVSLPVVQLWTVLQNTGIHDESVVIREQIQTVDASTRRRGEEFKEIDWDERFRKRILNLDGSLNRASAMEKNAGTSSSTSQSVSREICRLKLFDAVILESNIHATGCSTSSKFVQRSNYTKVFLQIRNGTTVPLVIPFPRESSHLYSF